MLRTYIIKLLLIFCSLSLLSADTLSSLCLSLSSLKATPPVADCRSYCFTARCSPILLLNRYKITLLYHSPQIKKKKNY
ncbi:hypothetical protein ACB094_05G111200 [Castanea mollissima]